MTHDEIRHWFQRFKYDPEYRDLALQRQVPMKTLCRYVGLDYTTLKRFLNDEFEPNAKTVAKILHAVECVRKGLRFKRIRPADFKGRGSSRWVVIGPFADKPVKIFPPHDSEDPAVRMVYGD
ncbi:MAG TPA: hypothetical protein VKD24_03525 [Candidatus Angelobacter sp.]|nr:hypothetical protein [Candidatus Angelobacter sp.]